MDALRFKLRKESVKNEIMSCAKMYLNKDMNVFDTYNFKKANPYYANKISYYFGSWADFYEELGVEKSSNAKRLSKLKESIEKKKTISVRNILACEMLVNLRESGLTYEEIAKRYGVSKQTIHQLTDALSVDSGLF